MVEEADDITLMTESPPCEHMAKRPFALEVGDRLIRRNGTYLAVVANANIEGQPAIIVEEHSNTGERVPHPQAPQLNLGHQPMPLSTAEALIEGGEFTLGHTPK